MNNMTFFDLINLIGFFINIANFDEIEGLHKHMDAQDEKLNKILKLLEDEKNARQN